jgi:DNA replication protein DnaC
MIAKNLAFDATIKGFSVLFITANELVNDLQIRPLGAYRSWLSRYAKPDLMVIDEIGYLSYNAAAADLLFQVIAARHEKRSTIVTTNRPFAEWIEIFPNSGCLVAMIDRLTENADILAISGESYRQKNAEKNSNNRQKSRTKT